jgi:MHS family proline/betaine transporter-like MFS transporter
MKILGSLNKKQREYFGLLQIGTFLEYFDIMIFVHFALLINDLFFPNTDPRTGMLVAAFSFCSTYLLRPIGALIFGYIGDRIGRKPTVIISSFMMGISCILMANIPTYEEVGILAAYGVTFCRILQSLSAQGEIIGVEVYLTETTKIPERYPIVALTSFFSSLGGVFAIALAVVLTTFKMDWRLAYWIGAGVSSIGFIARSKLRETPEFLKKKSMNPQEAPTIEKMKDNKNVVLSYFLISCGYPAFFYLCYIHFSYILKVKFGYSTGDVMVHNFIVSIMQSATFFFWCMLSYSVNPTIILRLKFLVFFPLVFLYPLFIGYIESSFQIMFLQLFIVFFSITDVPAAGLMIGYFPILKRFTSSSVMYAFSRISVYLITSFGLVYLTSYFGNWGVWLVMVPISLLYLYGAEFFAKKEGFLPIWKGLARKKRVSVEKTFHKDFAIKRAIR